MVEKLVIGIESDRFTKSPFPRGLMKVLPALVLALGVKLLRLDNLAREKRSRYQTSDTPQTLVDTWQKPITQNAFANML